MRWVTPSSDQKHVLGQARRGVDLDAMPTLLLSDGGLDAMVQFLLDD